MTSKVGVAPLKGQISENLSMLKVNFTIANVSYQQKVLFRETCKIHKSRKQGGNCTLLEK